MSYRWYELLLVGGWLVALFLHDLGHRLILMGFDPEAGPISFGLWVFLLNWRDDPSLWNGLLLLGGGNLTPPKALSRAPWLVRLAYFAAGPAVNLALAVLSFGLIRYVPAAFHDEASYFAGTNLALGLISLLPVPGLDGAHLIATLWRRATRGA